MPEATEATNIEAPVDAPVDETPSVDPAIEELARAFHLKQATPEPEPEPVREEPVVEPIAPEGIKTPEGEIDDSKLDQATRSFLGRIVAKQTKEQTTPLLDKIAQLEAELRLASAPKPEPEPEPIDDDLDAPIYTKREVLELWEKNKSADPDLKTVREMRESSEYSTKYIASLHNMFKTTSSEYNPDVQGEIVKELDQVLKNPKYPDRNPDTAAERNFYKAVANVFSRKAAASAANPTVGNGDKAPISATGLPTGSKVTPDKPSTVSLDEDSKRLARSFGLKPERIQEILKKDRG